MLGRCQSKVVGEKLKCDICNMEWDLYDLSAKCPRAEETPMEGKKNDDGKIRMELIPPELMIAVGDILTFGAEKYGDYNWAQGMAWSRMYGAMLRHQNAWWSGEDKDPESGRSHLWHVACCVAALIAYEMRGDGEDDRWKGPTG